MAFEELKKRAKASRGQNISLIDQLQTAGRERLQAPTLTAEDLFPEQVQQTKDAARQTSNARKRALIRAQLAGGGDVSGAGSVGLARQDQAASEQIQQQQSRFQELAMNIDQARKGRGLDMLSQALQGRSNIFQTDVRQRNRAEKLDIQKEQARKQRNVQLLSGLLNAGSGVASAALMACWVAEELYGEDSLKTHRIRGFMYNHFDKKGVFGEFAREYRDKGRQWASTIKENPELRRDARQLFDRIHNIIIA